MNIFIGIAIVVLFAGIWAAFSHFRKGLNSEIKCLRASLEEARNELREIHAGRNAAELKLWNRENVVRDLVVAEFALAETKDKFCDSEMLHSSEFLIAHEQNKLQAATLAYQAELNEARQHFVEARRKAAKSASGPAASAAAYALNDAESAANILAAKNEMRELGSPPDLNRGH